jgi:hypothetical protein
MFARSGPLLALRCEATKLDRVICHIWLPIEKKDAERMMAALVMGDETQK